MKRQKASDYDFMTFPMWLYLSPGCKLIGKSLDELLAEFKIDQALEQSYCKLPRQESTGPKDYTEIKGEKKFSEGVVLFIGTLGLLKELKSRYNLREVG